MDVHTHTHSSVSRTKQVHVHTSMMSLQGYESTYKSVAAYMKYTSKDAKMHHPFMQDIDTWIFTHNTDNQGVNRGARLRDVDRARQKQGLIRVRDDARTLRANWTVAVPEDKWEGMTGFIHQRLQDTYLATHKDPTEIEYYMCGPPMMVQAVEEMLDSLGVEPEMIAYDKFS